MKAPSKHWLERLIVLDAPQDIRGDVRAILESESRLATPQAGISNSTSLHHTIQLIHHNCLIFKSAFPFTLKINMIL